MIAPAVTHRTPADIIAPMFDRSGLPDRVQLAEDQPRHGLKTGDVFTWSDDTRGYVSSSGLICVRADYVRAHFFTEFNYVQPQRPEQAELF